jgi:serine/threonine protein kinase
VDDDALGRFLLDRGLLAPDEYEEADRERRSSGRPLAEILVRKSFLNAVQVQDALAALQKRVRYCPECRGPVFVTRLMEEGERCPRCLGPVEWQAESVVAQIRDVENIVQLTKDELPSDVRAARAMPGRIFGKYILVEEVGRGGAGVVHKAWDTMLAEYVALKFIRDQKPVHDTSREAKKAREEQILDLLQEARAALRLRHPHIVGVRDIGRIEQQFFIAMDFVEGTTLADHVRASQLRGGTSPLYEDPVFYLGVLRDVANAIHYAHTFPKPIVHCDLKPGNVLISRGGNAFVMDFGLARALDVRREDEEAGGEKVRGTPAYMAPEQLSGRLEAIGVGTDVYALGATLYELLAGRPAFTGEPLAILVQALRDKPERPTDVVRRKPESKRHESTKIMMKISRLEEICLRCLAKEPGDRYPSARHVAEELGRVIEALEQGREEDMVPPRVRMAQERSELSRVDEHITHLDVEGARRQWELLREKRDTTRVRHRLDDRRQQLLLVEQLRDRLVERLNAERPTFPELDLAGATLKNVEVLKATAKKLYLLESDRPRDAEWAQLPPAQVVAMAEALKMDAPEDRLALGVLCHHSRLAEQAARFLKSLGGTPFEEAARNVLESTS